MPLLRAATIALLTASAACTSSTPSEDYPVRFEGRVLIGGLPADTRAKVYVYYYSDSLPLGQPYSTVGAAFLDSLGSYYGQLGPYPTDHIDSLVARTTIGVCGPGDLQASVRLTAVSARPAPFTFPPFDLQWPAPPGRLARDSVVCGVTYNEGVVGEHPGLRLVFDSLTPLVYGRWNISHTATIGDSYGRFTGYVLGQVLVLPLEPTPGETCAGLVLHIPLGPDSTFGTAMIGGQPTSTCYVPASRMSLFHAPDGWPQGLPLALPGR